MEYSHRWFALKSQGKASASRSIQPEREGGWEAGGAGVEWGEGAEMGVGEQSFNSRPESLF